MLATRARLTFVVGLTFTTIGCRHQSASDKEPAATPKRVRCTALSNSDVQDQIELHGTVSPLPDRDAQIAAQVSGRILRVLVREGDRVRLQQPLARIDDLALTDQAKQAAAQLARADAEATLAAVSRVRVQRVFDRGIAARQELDDAQAKEATTHAGQSEARATVEIANRQLSRATVRSPLAGVVLKVIRRPGELVDGSPATPIVEVGDPSQLELVASATAQALVAIGAKNKAKIELPALPGVSLDGRVAAVSPAVDRTTGLGVVRIALNVGGVRPPVGVSGVVRIAVGAHRIALLAPAAALRSAAGNDGEVVVCGTDGRAHVVRVTRGIALGGLIEVLPASGDVRDPLLVSGSFLAVEPVLGISDGDTLEQVR